MIDEATVDFEDFSFGAFELELSQVPVDELKAIRKIEWLKTVLMDENRDLKHDLAMAPDDVMEELANGIQLFPEEQELVRLHREATKRFGAKRHTA